LSPWVITAKVSPEHGLPVAAMFTALVVLPPLPPELEPELELLELPPHAASSSTAAATNAGTTRLRRSRLID
jgi:hypothetical protein